MHTDEPSLLSHITEVRKKALDEGGLSTVIFCGTINNENDIAAALQIHRNIVEIEVNKEEVNVTGLLMGQSNSILHLLEGPCYSILRILNNLASHKDFIDGNQKGTIIFNTEDRPKRHFPEWYSCIIQEQKFPGDDLNNENALDIVFDLANSLLDLGNKLRTEPQDELDIGRYADKLPGKNMINSLAACDQFFTLAEYVEFYFDPYHVQLESEQSWPLERLVRY